MPIEDELQDRRNDYDVTNTVQVSSAPQVRAAVADLFSALYPSTSFDSVWLAFHDFERMFRGLDPNYHAVDTTYHDMQHTLDMTLALARLIAGHEMSVEPADRLGPDRAELAIVSALFHDVGYLRHRDRDAGAINGAVFTRSHVTRSGHYLESYLPRIGLEQFVPVIARIVHFTGYELNVDQIELEEPKDSVVGHLLGTADLVAQLSDRCYLEKCRDRLYPEFVLGGVAMDERPQGKVLYRSAEDLLGKTLSFYQTSARMRLENNFNRVLSLLRGVLRARPQPVHPLHPQEPDVLEHRHPEWRLAAAASSPALHHAGPGRRGSLDRARAATGARLERDAPARRPETAGGGRLASRRRQPQRSVVEDDGETRRVERDLDRKIGGFARLLVNLDVLAAVLVGDVLGPEHRVQRIRDAAREIVFAHAPRDRHGRLTRRTVLGGDFDAHEAVGAGALVDRDLGAIEVGARLRRFLRRARTCKRRRYRYFRYRRQASHRRHRRSPMRDGATLTG